MEIIRRPLVIRPGWMNAAGTLGFSPPASYPLPQPPSAFVTNPISYLPRRPAQDREIFSFPGGFLLHTGWPSPGFREVLRVFRARWARSIVPIWAHLLGDDPLHIASMIRVLEDVEGIEAVEISFSHQAGFTEIIELIRSGVGELPLVLSVPIDRIGEAWLKPSVDSGVSAISLTAPRGMLTIEQVKPVHGRLYGPSLFPLALAAVEKVLKFGVPVIAGGGIMRQVDLDALLFVGAAAAQLDCVLWRGWQATESG